MMTLTPMIQVHNLGLNFNRTRHEQYTNENFGGALWESEETRTFRVGLSPHWFEFNDFYYDGNWMKSITVLGIQIGVGEFWQANPLSKD